MPVPDRPAPGPARVLASRRLLFGLLVLFVMAGFGTLLLTGQNHHAEAKIACERFVRHRLPPAGIRFSHETVRDLSATRHLVTGTAFPAGQAPKRYTCTVSHRGNTWVLDGMTGV